MSKDMPSVSVVIPSYNSVRFIREALESAFQQTRQPAEIIVVDDASTDGTPELVTNISRTAPVEIRLIQCQKNHGGPPAPLNIGIARANGDLIATLDHDDRMLPRKLELQVRLYETCRDLGLIICRVKYQSAETSRDEAISNTHAVVMQLPRQKVGDGFFRVKAADAYNAVVTGCYPLTCSSFLFPKAVWQTCGGFDEELRSMADLGFLQAVTRRHDLGIVTADLVQWTVSPDSLFVASRRKELSSQRLRVYKKFDYTLLTPDSKRLLRKQMREQLLWGAYMSREEGDYWGALSSYLMSFYHGGCSREGIYGLGCLFPHFLYRAARRAAKTFQRGLMKRA